MANEEGREITIEDGRKFEYMVDSGVTVTYRLAIDVTDEKHKFHVVLGTYENKEGEKFFTTNDSTVFDVLVDVDLDNSDDV